MISVSWNYRGLGNPQKVRALKELKKNEDPNWVFLSETKRTASEWQRLRVKSGFTNCFPVDCQGRRGGFALL